MPGCPERLRRRPLAALALALAAAVALTPGDGAAYVDQPPPAHTGGFGEPTCSVCHRSVAGEDDRAAGTVDLTVPTRFAPATEYEVTVRLVRPGMRRAGFQLSVRHGEGDDAGRQAGELSAPSSAVRAVVAHGVTYVGHTVAGSAAVEKGVAEWRVRWRSPVAPVAPVVFHFAANAGNDDDSELGDSVILASAVSRPTASP